MRQPLAAAEPSQSDRADGYESLARVRGSIFLVPANMLDHISDAVCISAQQRSIVLDSREVITSCPMSWPACKHVV